MNHRKAAILLVASCIAWSVSGCATIFNPGPDVVPVSSRPPGAAVSLDGKFVGRTPLFVSVPRSSDGVFVLELDGYKKAVVDRDKVVNGVFFVNAAWIVFWPAVPVAALIDVFAGNAGKYSTLPLNVELVPAPAGRE